MTREALPPQYSAAAVEAPLYRWWLERQCFRADAASGREPYVIVMPPPNVTANLHMGHGLNTAVQDALIRHHRMRGREALWLPGTDHAGIATQTVVERLLAREGRTRHDLGREAFVERVWEFVGTTGATILRQLEAIGCSADWSRTYFTLDPGPARAVREAFVSLYERGLIYRGLRLINWDPVALTALADEEVEMHEQDGSLWHLRYPLEDGGHLVVATTRPETMLGDTAVAVHPDDERYRLLIGRHVRLPLVDRRIPVVGDAAIDPAFGTGAVKVTPAHDPLDHEIGGRHGLEPIDIMHPDATLNDRVPLAFRGLDRFTARAKVVEAFRALGLLEKVEAHRHAVGRSYRSGAVIEPRLSEQWFVAMQPLAEPALAAYRAGRLRFVPERRGEEFERWLGQIRDWCISRQLWWGHRIPVWYDAAGRPHASRADLATAPDGGPVRQDPDVLDTWFSSALVPFSGLGWPDRTADLARFHPGHTLVTGPDIIFFWVARMVMMGLAFTGELPFTTVYLNGIVRDPKHRKMSKSAGNGIDPLEVVRRYGADALRYTVISSMAAGTDVILDPDDLDTSFAPGRNFANKLWNAGRFILGTLDGPVRPLAGRAPDVVRRDELTLHDRWLVARCDAVVREVGDGYARHRLNEAATAAYHFLWSDLADWYIEAVKPRLYGQAPGGDVARAVLVRCFDTALRLLHPVMPFITEALWQRLPGRPDDATITRARWPEPDARAADDDALAGFALVQALVGAVRQLRAEYAVQPGRVVHVTATPASPAAAAAFAAETTAIERLAKARLSVGVAADEPGAGAVLPDGTAVHVPLGDLVDLARERQRLAEESARLAGLIEAQERKLGNEQFVGRAPAEVVEKERTKLAGWRDQRAVVDEKLRRLGTA